MGVIRESAGIADAELGDIAELVKLSYPAAEMSGAEDGGIAVVMVRDGEGVLNVFERELRPAV